MNAMPNIDPTDASSERPTSAANLVAEVLAASPKPAALSAAEATVAELRAELGRLNVELTAEIQRIQSTGANDRPSTTMRDLQVKVDGIAARLRPARADLAKRREEFSATFLAAVSEHRLRAGLAIAHAVALLDDANLILSAIDQRAMHHGLTTMGLSHPLQQRHALRSLALACGADLKS